MGLSEMFAVTMVAAIWWFEYYKFDLMATLYYSGGAYPVFPWSSLPQLSRSSPAWLHLHLSIALLHLTLVVLRLIVDHQLLQVLFVFTHFIFVVMVIYNINHFGSFSAWVAVILNGIPLLGMLSCYRYGPITFPEYWFYLLYLSSPILLEAGLRLYSLW